MGLNLRRIATTLLFTTALLGLQGRREERRTVQDREGRPRQRHHDRHGHRDALRRHHRPGRQPGLRHHLPALRRLQQPGEEGPDPRRARPDAVPGAGRAAPGRRHQGAGRGGQRADHLRPPEAADDAASRRRRNSTRPRRAYDGGARPGRSRPGPRSARPRRTSATRRSSRPSTASSSTAQYDVGQTVAASFQAPTLFPSPRTSPRCRCRPTSISPTSDGSRSAQIARFTVDAYPERGVPRAHLPDPPQRAGQPERHHLPGDHRSRRIPRDGCVRR